MLGALSLSGRHLQSGYRPRRLIGCRCRRSTQKATGDQIAIEGITTDAPSVFFAASFASPTPLRSPLNLQSTDPGVPSAFSVRSLMIRNAEDGAMTNLQV